MNLTIEFQSSCEKIRKSKGLQKDILAKQKRPGKFFVDSTDVRYELQTLKRYLVAIRNPYLRIPPNQQAEYPKFPRPSEILHYTEKERNQLDHQLLQKLDQLRSKVEALESKSNFQTEVITILLAACVDLKRLLGQLIQQRNSTFAMPKSKHPMNQLFLDDDDDTFDNIPPELLRQLEMENQELAEHLDGDLEQLRIATQSIGQVADMQNTIAMQLSMQTENITLIHRNVEESKLRIEEGNKYLKKAQDIFGGPKYWVLVFFILMSLFLLFVDYIFV